MTRKKEERQSRLPFFGKHKRSDQEIAEAAARAIKSHVWVPTDVQVTVENSLVTLRGEVNWQYQRSAASTGGGL